MEYQTLLLIFAIIFAFYMAWNMGANDVANAMGTSVGSGALTLKRALFVAAILEFAGAYFVGSDVSMTIESGIVSTTLFENNPYTLVWGMLSSLLAAGIWLQIASFYGWPVSTTHSLIGALVGFGLIAGGPKAIQWQELFYIVVSWILSPLLGGILAYAVFSIVRKKILITHSPLLQAKKLAPYFVFLVLAMLSSVILYDGMKNLHLDFSLSKALLLSCGIGVIGSAVAMILLRRIVPKDLSSNHLLSLHSEQTENYGHLRKAIRHLEAMEKGSPSDVKPKIDEIVRKAHHLTRTMKPLSLPITTPQYVSVERLFAVLQVMSACCMAFAHGANDVANAIGPLASIVKILKTGQVSQQSPIPSWILMLGGFGIIIGLASWGWRVIETIGKKITELTPTRGFSAEFGAAMTILIASKMGLPISTTHTLVGAVLGVGLARGIDALNLSMLRDIGTSWLVTVPAGAILSIAIYYAFSFFF